MMIGGKTYRLNGTLCFYPPSNEIHVWRARDAIQHNRNEILVAIENEVVMKFREFSSRALIDGTCTIVLGSRGIVVCLRDGGESFDIEEIE